jgi:sugar phosphate isomerase/epimerase
MTRLRPDLTFCIPWAMIQHLPFAEQIETVKKIGYQELSLHPYYIGDFNRAGVSLRDMKMMAEDAGLSINRVDALTTWAPDWRATNFGDEYNLTVAMDSTMFLELSAFFGCRYLSLNAMWKPGHYSNDQVAEFYRAICEKAAPYGITCDIEPIPMWGVQGLDDALEIIEKADVDNAGIVFDVTHFRRAGTSMEVLESVPGELIHCVQLCDGTVPATLSLEDECFNRMWPGEGDFGIAEIVAVLDKTGGLSGIGPEVFSPVYAKEGTPGAWIAAKVNECMARFPQLLGAGRG